MVLLARMLCRWSGCLAPNPKTRERAAKAANPGGPGKVTPDDLTTIRGIGIAAQNRLYRAGIKSYAQLAGASPEQMQAILGKLARGADVEDWIAQARDLASKEES